MLFCIARSRSIFWLPAFLVLVPLKAQELETTKSDTVTTRVFSAIYQRPAGSGPEIPARLIGDYGYRPYSPTYKLSPYRSRSDYGRPNYYAPRVYESYEATHDFGGQGSWYEPRSYSYTSRYPFSSTQVPAYRYPFARDYYSYGPGYSNYGYAFGYPYGWYGGFPGWYGGFGYWGYAGVWGGPWFPYRY